jgi:hypothetical protein
MMTSKEVLAYVRAESFRPFRTHMAPRDPCGIIVRGTATPQLNLAVALGYNKGIADRGI